MFDTPGILNLHDTKRDSYICKWMSGRLESAEGRSLHAVAHLAMARSQDSGTGILGELLSLKKPNILIPLPCTSSRGDQLLNARSFESQGFSIVIDEDDLTNKLLLEKVQELYFNRKTYVDAMRKSSQRDAIGVIVGLIENAVSEKEKS